jgi:hypothetical protein
MGVFDADETRPYQGVQTTVIRGVRRGLAADMSVVAAVQHGSTEGFIGEVKDHDDAKLFILSAVTVSRYSRPRGRKILYRLTADSSKITEDTRDDLPARLAGRLCETL